jgi:hypothetical protein
MSSAKAQKVAKMESSDLVHLRVLQRIHVPFGAKASYDAASCIASPLNIGLLVVLARDVTAGPGNLKGSQAIVTQSSRKDYLSALQTGVFQGAHRDETKERGRGSQSSQFFKCVCQSCTGRPFAFAHNTGCIFGGSACERHSGSLHISTHDFLQESRPDICACHRASVPSCADCCMC